MLTKTLRHISYQVIQRNGRGVGSHDAVGPAMGIDLPIEVPFDLKVFQDHFNDKIAV